MALTREELRGAVREAGLSAAAVCAHSSLRSFGRVEGGAQTLVEAFLDEGCTLLVPTFSSAFAVAPPPSMRPERNAWDYGAHGGAGGAAPCVFAPDSPEVDGSMGAVPRAVLSFKGRQRGDHPLDSFAAVGPHAEELTRGQTPSDVYAPLRRLAELRGYAVLMGVGLNRLTLLHAAEERAGRGLFLRWAKGSDGGVRYARVGGCSEGFGRLEPALKGVERTRRVGESLWRIFPAREALELAAEAIRREPSVTHCPDPDCERCDDAVAGGPLPSAAPAE